MFFLIIIEVILGLAAKLWLPVTLRPVYVILLRMYIYNYHQNKLGEGAYFTTTFMTSNGLNIMVMTYMN